MTKYTPFNITPGALFTYQKFNGFSHLLMFPVAFVLTVILVITADRQESMFKVFAASIYGFTMMSVFLSSGLYHLIPSGPKLKKILRRIDQASIFPYIAATSTMVTLLPLWESNGLILTILIWTFSLGGMYMKVTERDLPFSLEILVYATLGCLCFVDVDVLVQRLPGIPFYILASGGACYLIGALVVGLEDILDKDGSKYFHEFWHILVIIGTLLHWWVIQNYVIYM